MPLNASVRNIPPLAWCLGVSAITNVVTMVAVLYLAFGTPKVYVSSESISAYVRDTVDINDRAPVRVRIVP